MKPDRKKVEVSFGIRYKGKLYGRCCRAKAIDVPDAILTLSIIALKSWKKIRSKV